MVTQAELLEQAGALTAEAIKCIGRDDVSQAQIANNLAAARLLFDMAHSGVMFPINAYLIEGDDNADLRPGSIIMRGRNNG